MIWLGLVLEIWNFQVVNLVCHLKQFSKRYKFLFSNSYFKTEPGPSILICHWNEEPLRTHISWTELVKIEGRKLIHYPT